MIPGVGDSGPRCCNCGGCSCICSESDCSDSDGGCNCVDVDCTLQLRLRTFQLLPLAGFLEEQSVRIIDRAMNRVVISGTQCNFIGFVNAGAMV